MRPCCVAVVLGGLLLIRAHSAEDAIEQRVQRVLDDMNSDNFQKREAAAAAAGELPVEALPFLLKAVAAESNSLEMKHRLPKALENLCARHTKALVQKRVATRRAWLKKNLVDAYEQSGSKNEKWDALAREALGLALSAWSQDPKSERNEGPRILALAAKARAAGCDDPLIEYLHARSNEWINGAGSQETLDLHMQAAAHLKKSNYPFVFKYYSYLNAARLMLAARPIPSNVETRKRYLSQVYGLALHTLADVLKDPEIPAHWIEDMLKIAADLGKAEDKDRKKSIEALCESIEKGRPRSALAHAFRGDSYVAYAWDARGSGWASSVTDEGWKLMKERLAIAEEELNLAWAMDPSSPFAAKSMIGVVLGSGGARDKMELWFKRAMAADPYYEAACEAKINFLQPKWHGSREEMLAFGRECLATGDWDGDVPHMLVDIHEQLACYSDKGYRFDLAYFKKPEVWKDIQEVYESCLKARPKDVLFRSRYACNACRAEKWDVADQQFKLLGQDAYKSVFGSVAEFNRQRELAAKKAAEAKP